MSTPAYIFLQEVPVYLQGHYHCFVQAMSANGGNPSVVRMLSNQARSLYSMTQPIASKIMTNPHTGRTVITTAAQHGVRVTLASLLPEIAVFMLIALVVLAIVYWAKVEHENNLRRSGKTADLQNLEVAYNNFMNENEYSPLKILKTRNCPPDLRRFLV